MKFNITIILIYLTTLFENTSFATQSIKVNTVSSKDIGYYIFKDICRKGDLSDTLILFDIDDTLITKEDATFIGSSVFYDFMKTSVINTHNLSNAHADNYIEALFNSIYKYLAVQLTDPSLPELLNLLKEKGATIIGFTSRERALLDNTLDQLKRFNIKFSNINCLEIGIKHGLYTIGSKMEKGDAAKLLLGILKPKSIQHLIFFDDLQWNLLSVKNKIFSNKKITSAHYIQITNTVPFDSGLTFDSLCQFIESNKDNIAFRADVMNDPFTKEVYAQCRLKK